MYLITQNKDFKKLTIEQKVIKLGEVFHFAALDLNVFRVDDRIKFNLHDLLSFIKKSQIQYMFLSSDSGFIQSLMRTKSRFIYVPPDKAPEPYLNLAFTSFQERRIPHFGFIRNPICNAAGILPLVVHEDELFCVFGLDKTRTKYSDFGGGFDKTYTTHKGSEAYKNLILGDLQIFEGVINQQILVDHYITSENRDRVVGELDKGKDDKSERGLGYGDPNTKYTGFRELVEETACRSDRGVTQIFKTESIYKKLFIDDAYVYLGGDRLYGYDLYVVVLSPDDLNEPARRGFMKLYETYKADEDGFKEGRADSVVTEPEIKITGNKEMYGVDIIPLQYIVSQTQGIDYGDYRSKKPSTKNRYRKKESVRNKEKEGCWHEEMFGAKVLDNMRGCFADALVKYSQDLGFITKHYTSMSPILTRGR